MEIPEKLLKLAQDELTEYSTRPRKFEKMRPKLSMLLSLSQRTELKETLTHQLDSAGTIARLVEQQRQTVALPFWGIAGLALLAGFLGNKWAWPVAAGAVAAAISLQRWGWEQQARRLLLDCIEDMEARQAAGK